MRTCPPWKACLAMLHHQGLTLWYVRVLRKVPLSGWDTLISALYLYLTAQTHYRLLCQAEEGLGAAEARGKEGRNDSLRSTREVKTNKAINHFSRKMSQQTCTHSHAHDTHTQWTSFRPIRQAGRLHTVAAPKSCTNKLGVSTQPAAQALALQSDDCV